MKTKTLILVKPNYIPSVFEGGLMIKKRTKKGRIIKKTFTNVTI